MKNLRCLHTSLSQQSQCPISWVCKVLGPCQFSVVVVVSNEEPHMSPYISITAVTMSYILDVSIHLYHSSSNVLYLGCVKFWVHGNFLLLLSCPMKNLRCLHTSLSQQSQCPLSSVCKVLGPCQFSARLRPLLDMRIYSKSLARSITRLPDNSSVTVQWLPVHVGISGNELADSLAKPGATTQLDERDLFSTIKTQCLQEWKSNAAHMTGTEQEGQAPVHPPKKIFTYLPRAYLVFLDTAEAQQYLHFFYHFKWLNYIFRVWNTYPYSHAQQWPQKIDTEPEQQLYTPKKEDFATTVIEMHGDI
ncbi:hypothetical protein LAZ67_9003328 [Cordylochernes scorpioides]|uniref:RNase H type-1 domain-containing protein n=1 Tax=Cordylochernes scorpioides TaxID=51811 RepID=A0ABY6KUF5_9ARAC|nr:hypothetical protein LAZ67_9003328 [Cordylochernes scorpioides]